MLSDAYRCDGMSCTECDGFSPFGEAVAIAGGYLCRECILEAAGLVTAPPALAGGAHLVASCTGATARWCPACGDCSCGFDPASGWSEEASATCPLHGEASLHALRSEPRAIPALAPATCAGCSGRTRYEGDGFKCPICGEG